MSMDSNSVHFMSRSNEWTTPQDFFDALNAEFNFTLDAAATPENTKCKRFFTVSDNGLNQSWQGERVFLNPPYGREIGQWIKKAYIEAQKPNTTVVMLIPARTDTKAWHRYILGTTAEVRFIPGRLRFGGGQMHPSRVRSLCSAAPFPSAVVIFQ